MDIEDVRMLKMLFDLIIIESRIKDRVLSLSKMAKEMKRISTSATISKIVTKLSNGLKVVQYVINPFFKKANHKIDP